MTVSLSFFKNINNMQRLWNFILKILPYYYSLIASLMFLWIAESYITSALDSLNAWCICDLNKNAFGWTLFLCFSCYIGISIWKHVKKGLYVSHRYISWWSICITQEW